MAVVGGGCAALTAAFELTRPELEGRFDVTVYQMGFRLGGKGASGRGANGRIEEHGLHLWMGYYENAFRVMRDCYAELARDGGHPWRFEDGFSPADFNAAMDLSPAGTWRPWKVEFPRIPGLPGDPEPPRLGVADYLGRAARLLGTLLETLEVERGRPLTEVLRRPPPTPEELSALITRLSRYGVLVGLGAAIEAVHWLALVLESATPYPQSLTSRLLDTVSDVLQKSLAGLTERDNETRRLWEVGELILATLRGAVRFRLAFDARGFDAIDDYDCREWLRLNGASERAINSAFIRALYDLAFAYENGDPARPAIAAGSALRGAFRAFFSYRGAFFFRMNAGMGDVVFAPLYLALARRGVRFEFFHKLTDVGLSPPSDASPHVAALTFDVQAKVAKGSLYQPLVEVEGLPCWPARPDFSQLVGGQKLAARGIDFESQWDAEATETRTLHVGSDFDFVVLGVGLGTIPYVCRALLERDPRWRSMVEHVKSVPTQAFQLWLDRDVRELGWTERAVNLSGFVEPFDTWADMTHLLPRESWARPPKTIAYFCNALPDSWAAPAGAEAGRKLVREATERVRDAAVAFLNGEVRELWPAAQAENGEFRWEFLSDGGAQSGGAARFDTQYLTANVRPSDRYSQALPGSTRYRISPLDRSYDNFTVAGDWTNSSLNMGCVEAAVMSGLLAAHALSGWPKLSSITGYDHP
ncbi:MAG TPA: FAD-dependent oxidoreductase [Polyangiaceae bacterium]|nr:FAD-dependent oxidoreductase [Polyangiaceae bacterium]